MTTHRFRLFSSRDGRGPRAGRNLRVETLESRHLLSVEPLGPAFPVSPDAPGQQYASSYSGNSTAMDDAGNSVVAWTHAVDSVQPYSIRAQRFDAGGSPLGDDFLVNVDPNQSAGGASVAMNRAGEFVVVWSASSNPWNEILRTDVYARVFAADGSSRSEEIPVNNLRNNDQSVPSVAIDDDGDFVVAWSSCFQDNGSGCDVHARRFDANGTPRANEFRVADVNQQGAVFPTVSMSGDGRFVVTWGQNEDVYARLFAANGTTARPAFVVNDFTFHSQSYPSVSMGRDGDFVVAWTGTVQGGFAGISARRFDTTDQPMGGQFVVDLRQNGSGEFPRVDVAPDGSFIVGWHGDQEYIRAFDSHGVAISEAIQVSDHTAGGISTPSIAVSDGLILAAWDEHSTPGASARVFARRFAILRPPASEIRVVGNRHDINSGDDSPSLDDYTDFGAAVLPAGIVERTFAVINEGAGPLVFTGSPNVMIQGAAASDYRVTTQLPEAIPAGGSATFTIEFQPKQLGLRTALVRIGNDDPDEAEFTFAIQGVGRDSVAGTIRGTKWNDLNGNAALDDGEPGLADVVIYLDSDGDGQRDSGERYTVTGLDGRYEIRDLAPGQYTVAEVFEDGWIQTSPGLAHGYVREVNLGPGAVVEGVDFFNHLAPPPPTASVVGISLGSTATNQSITLGDSAAQLDNRLANAIDQLTIRFNQPLMIRKQDVSMTDALANNLQIATCDSDGGGAGTTRLTCLLVQPLRIGRYTLTIDDAATDRRGDPLDGEWQNPTGPGRVGDVFPSGDGEPGGDFGFRFDLNLGDVDLNGRVDLEDLNLVRNHFGEAADSPGDADGDRDADLNDLNEVRNHFGVAPAPIANAAPIAAPQVIARDAVFGMLAADAFAKPVRRAIVNARGAR